MTTYYVDATNGSDAKDGLSEANAWQTIAKVNGETYSAGDSILFKRGETWAGTMLAIASSGTLGNRITLADYGSGALPIIDGNDTVNCFNSNGKDYLTLQNIRFVDGLNFGITINGSYIDVIDCEADGCGNDNVIVDGADNIVVSGLVSTSPYERVGGPRITCMEVIDGSYDIEVRDCLFSSSPNIGFSLHSHNGERFPYNVWIHNCTVTDSADFGFAVSKLDATADTDRNVLIENCLVIGQGVTDWGLYVSQSLGEELNGITFSKFRVVDVARRPLYCNTTATFLHCVFSGSWPSQFDSAASPVAHNCTFCRLSAALTIDVVNATDDLTMRNCIIYTGGTTIIEIDAGVTNTDIDYCLYHSVGADPVTGTVYKWGGVAKNWANWKADSGQDGNSPTPADPLFQDVANDRFELGRSSPALNVGTPIAGDPFYGAAPDCGRWEMRWPSMRTHQRLMPQWE